MRFKYFLPALAALAASACLAQSPVEIQQQRLQKSHKIILFGEGDADSTQYQDLINRFYEDQFRHSQDPRAPYFMLMSRNGQMAMGVGGTIEAIGAYDFDGEIPSTNFAPYDIPMPLDPSSRRAMQTSMGHSALFFSVFGTDKRFGNYQLYIQAKFNGPHNTFKFDKAYATVGDWTLGLANSTFVDPAAQPSTVETQGPNSETSAKRVLLRYMHNFTKNVTLAVSLEDPDPEIDATTAYKPCANYAPNVAAFVQYRWGKQHVRLSGIMTNMRYRNLVANTNHLVSGWGVNLTTIFRPVSPLTVYGGAVYGKGIGSLINDLAEGSLSLIPTQTAGHLYAPRCWGYYGALQYNFSPSVFSTVIFSQQRMLPDHTAAYDGASYKYGIYGTANVFWNITPRCQMGAEFNVGQRKNMDGAHRMAYRAGLLAQFSF